jgi:radical SAM protein with 4Fe4S-binding SPASM domain
MLVRTEPDGTRRYFRAQSPEHEEFTYRRPFILELEITRRCNLHCVHCYAEAADQPFPDELSREEIKEVLDEGYQLGIRELSLTGGEVLLRTDFLDIIDDALDRDYHIRFVTNATLLDETLLAGLCQRPIKLITVSLDGVSAKVHERIRGRGSHDSAVKAIERLQQAGFRVSVITAFSTLNMGEFEALLAFCIDRRLDWQVQMTSAKGRCPRRITMTPDEYYSLGEAVARAMALDLPIHLIPMDDLATPSMNAPLDQLFGTWQGHCTGGLLNLFVRANGDVTPCSALAFPENIVGNVRTESLVAICHEERCRHNLTWVQADKLTGECALCARRSECNGGCPEILLSMCQSRTENEYCFWRIEQGRILDEVLQGMDDG